MNETRADASASARNLIVEALGVYTAARGVGLLVLFIAEDRLNRLHAVLPQKFRTWNQLLVRWDGIYYQNIVTRGYPRVLPTDVHGNVLQNSWAFFPVFPLVTGLLMRVTGLSFATAAFIINLAAGAGAAVVLALVVRRVANDATALRAVAFWMFLPTAFVLQVPYSEAIYVLVVSTLFLLLLRGQFGLAAGLLMLSGLCRGYVLPLSAAAAAAVAEYGWATRQHAAREGRTPPGWLRIIVDNQAAGWLLVAAIAAPFLWMAVAGLVTGRPDAYKLTQQAWGYALDPVLWLERWPSTLRTVGDSIVATTALIVLAFSVALTLKGLALRIPLAFKAYMVVATLLLFALALPESVPIGSLPRFAFGVITAPIVMALLVRRTWMVVAVVVGFTLLQYWWVLNVWSGRAGVAP
ncbi:MAG: hypothetical protein ABI051_12605 [Vicinamibacterales bacterium]